MPVLPSPTPTADVQRFAHHVAAAVVERANQFPIMVRAISKSPKTIVFSGTNLGKKSVRGFAGIVRVFDLIGNEILDISIENETAVEPGKTVEVSENIAATKGNELADFFVTTENKNLTYVYMPMRVVDDRGHVHYVRAISPGGK